LVSIGARDIPAMRQMTWIGDVHSGWGWAETFDPWLGEFLDRAGELPVRVGMLGQDLMRSPFLETLRASIGDSVALEPADAAFASLLSVRRPREMAMIREACSLADAASRAMESAWRGAADAMASAVAAERAARAMAAHDVRVLFSVDGGRTLLSFYGVVEGRADPMVAYIAVKYMGYWADAFVTITDRPTEALARAREALDAMLAVARPGSSADALITAGHIDGLPAHPVLGGAVGQPIGLALSEQPELRANTAAILETGRVYSLRVGAADDNAGSALLSAIIHVGEDGVEILRRSDRS
jgi:Xaa-Pro aminopeptidase